MKNISKPMRYAGVEAGRKGTLPKNPALKISLAFPEVYELGMSHYGFLLLYHLLRKKGEYLVDRTFAPWTDMEGKIRRDGAPLKSYLYGIPLSEFDVIGFSLAYELSLTNVLTILDLGRVPLLASHRKEGDPLIICGGALAGNPEPFGGFFDAIFIGEGEEGLLEILEKVRVGKASGAPRREILRPLTGIEGIYVPGLYTPLYDKTNALAGYAPEGGAPPVVRRRILPDLDTSPLPEDHVIPSMRTVHDRLPIEVARGCTRGCRFCQAGYYYRPFRERDADSILNYLDTCAIRSGFDEIGFLALSSSDYSCIHELIKKSMNLLEGDRISISLPSLRINSVSEDLIRELKRVRKGGFTIAPEAGRESLRQVINKDITDDEIFSTVDWIFRNGWNTVKMYFMIGLPGEAEQDISSITDLSVKAGNIARRYGRKTNVTVSLSTFVPKPHTPFQWAPQITREEMEEKIRTLKKELLRNRKITLKWHSPHMSWLEGIISRGDRKIGTLISKAYDLGARFDGWSDQLQIDLWEKALGSLNIDPDAYTGPRETDRFLPWDIVDTGTSKSFLLKEWRKSQNGETTPDCRTAGCTGCGVCITGNLENRMSAPIEVHHGMSSTPPVMTESPPQGYLVIYRKVGNAAFLSALEVQSLISRSLRRSGLPVKFSEGFNPKPKLSFPAALPVGVESRFEFFAVAMTGELIIKEILSAFSEHIPPDLRPISVIPWNGKISSLMLEEEFEILPDGGKGALPSLRPGRDWEDTGQAIEVVHKGHRISVTATAPPGKSGIKKMTETLFGCTLADLDIKITKTSLKIFSGAGDEQRQIYPHKQQGLRNTGSGS